MSDEDWYTPVSSIAPLVDGVRTTAASRVTHDVEWRKRQLRAIIRLVQENREKITEALKADLGQTQFFCDMMEMGPVVQEAEYALANVDDWMKDEYVPTPFPTNLTRPCQSVIRPTPLGTVLIMGAWNFPFNLTVLPMIGVIAAGNACIVKPSELSTHTARLVGSLISSYLDNSAIVVVQGAVPQATELLKHRFDAICYTGNNTVARIVGAAAAKHLTPCLLELGGKSPVIICDDADIPTAALRIMWAKFTGNVGQFCITADYVVVVESLKEKLVAEFKKVLIEFYGENPRESEDFGRIINKRHAQRLANLLDGSCTILHGGKYDIDAKYMEPTIVEATAKSTVMKDEIFGPILPVIGVLDVDEAIRFVNTNYSAHGDHPLSLYVFARGKANQEKVINQTQSGAVCVNDLIKHSANQYMPFGGVGNSGMGAYHGKYGFNFFSHLRSVFILDNHVSSRRDPGNWVTFPPYNDKKLAALRLVAALPKVWSRVRPIVLLSVPVVAFALLYRYPAITSFVLEFNINTAIDLVGRSYHWVTSS